MNKENQHRVTIKDVARQADVSIATVSKIVNGKDEHISAATRREFDTLKFKKVPQSLETGYFFCQIFCFYMYLFVIVWYTKRKGGFYYVYCNHWQPKQ